MSYIALYRKYRPTKFSEIIGQEQVTDILKNQIKNGKISHAYIFSGSRGTGKTSVAKIFARAINCLNPKDGEPCNECSACKGILDSSITDVIEMDAASNNSVENIRQIREEVNYATVDVKYRVYIIDEAHMLSTSAFNALLKTIEEPPENVIFILATTEQSKIPVTILSRCLRFEFNKITEENIIKRLKYVLNEEKIKYDDDALEYIAKAADGGMRDALSILDRCIFENTEKLSFENIQKVLGTIDEQVITDIVNNILNYDSISVIENINKVAKSGKSLRQLIYKLNEKLLDILIQNVKNKNEKENARIVKIIDEMSELDNKLKNSTQPTIQLQADMVRICSINTKNITSDTDTKTLNQNSENNQLIEKLNDKINLLEENVKIVSDKLNSLNVSNLEKCEKVTKHKKTNIDLSNYIKFDKADEIEKCILEKGKITIYTMLSKSDIYIDNKTLIIVTYNAYSYDNLKKQENIDEIKKTLKEKLDKELEIKIELIEKEDTPNNKIEELLKNENVDYTKID